jgi:hypothetical protein
MICPSLEQNTWIAAVSDLTHPVLQYVRVMLLDVAVSILSIISGMKGVRAQKEAGV